MIGRRLGGAAGLAALAAAYASAFPGLAAWLGPISAALIAWTVVVIAGALGLDLLLAAFEDVLAWDDPLEPPLPALAGLVAVTAVQLGLVTGAAIAGWPVTWMWWAVAASASITAIAAFRLWDREERLSARFWAGATRPGPHLLPSDQRTVLERLDGNTDPLRLEKDALDRLAGDAALPPERAPELSATAWKDALTVLERHGWIRTAPHPTLTEQGRAALAHDRSLRLGLTADALEATLRQL